MGYLQAYIEAEQEQTKKEDLPEDVKEAMEERASIMEIDGGLTREEADKQAYCLYGCKITEPVTLSLCREVKPCPKLKGK